MFDVGWSELVVIGVVALIAIGPKELPSVLRSLGQWMTKIRRMAAEFQGQFQEAMREAEIVDLKKEVDNLKSSFDTPLDSNWSPDSTPSSALASEPSPASDVTPADAAVPPMDAPVPTSAPVASSAPAPSPAVAEPAVAAPTSSVPAEPPPNAETGKP
jgi:sec-independent protein translocase protein TatB